MYKKIKNGSFMNWIWFIICVLPIFIVFLACYRNGDNWSWSTKVENEPTPNLFFELYFNPGNTIVNDDYTIKKNSEQRYCDFSFSIPTENGQTIYDKLYYYVIVYSTTLKINNTTTFDVGIPFKVAQYGNTIVNVNECELNYLYSGEIPVDVNRSDVYLQFGDSATGYYYNCIVGVFISNIEIPFNNIDDIENWQNFITYSYTGGTLEEIKNSIETNGFISQGFLDFSSFFGVNNLYYSLACYYIEYLLIIALLHLAFDVLYMLPNICHKFMEKIGGDRD